MRDFSHPMGCCKIPRNLLRPCAASFVFFIFSLIRFVEFTLVLVTERHVPYLPSSPKAPSNFPVFFSVHHCARSPARTGGQNRGKHSAKQNTTQPKRELLGLRKNQPLKVSDFHFDVRLNTNHIVCLTLSLSLTRPCCSGRSHRSPTQKTPSLIISFVLTLEKGT